MANPETSKSSLSDQQRTFVTSFLVAPAAPAADAQAWDAPPGPGLVELQKMRLAYTESRKRVMQELDKLEAEICKLYSDEPNADQINKIAKRVHEGIRPFDDKLVDQLDAALNADDPAARRALEQKAAAQIKTYLSALDQDPVLSILDDNPIYPISAQETMLKTLTALEKRLTL